MEFFMNVGVQFETGEVCHVEEDNIDFCDNPCGQLDVFAIGRRRV
jgi:hypothetical protein